MDLEGNITNKNDPNGVSVTYESATVCDTTSVMSLNFKVFCDETMEEPVEPINDEG